MADSYLDNLCEELTHAIISSVPMYMYTYLSKVNRRLNELMKLYQVTKYPPRSSFISILIKNDHLALLLWTSDIIAEVKGNKVHTVKDKYRGIWNSDWCADSAKYGRLEILQWLRENGCHIGNRTCILSAEYNHFEILKWSHNNGCNWNCRRDDSMCSFAASNGNLEMLQWARLNGFQWNNKVFRLVAENGHLEILKWIKCQGLD